MHTSTHCRAFDGLDYALSIIRMNESSTILMRYEPQYKHARKKKYVLNYASLTDMCLFYFHLQSIAMISSSYHAVQSVSGPFFYSSQSHSFWFFLFFESLAFITNLLDYSCFLDSRCERVTLYAMKCCYAKYVICTITHVHNKNDKVDIWGLGTDDKQFCGVRIILHIQQATVAEAADTAAYTIDLHSHQFA